jgi:hypothetical protein
VIHEAVEDRQPVGAHDELVVLRVEVLRDGPRMFQLVELRLVEADRERLDGPAGGLRHQPDDEARVDPAGEERAQRHVADHVRPYGVGQHGTQRARGVGLAAAKRLGGADLPVLDDVGAAVFPPQEVARRQLAHAFEERSIARRVQKREVVVERLQVELPIDRSGGEERLDLGPEVEPAAPLRKMKRLDARAVARQQQRAPRAVPQRDPEHPS